MAWLAKDEDRSEWLFTEKPVWKEDGWYPEEGYDCVPLEEGSIYTLTGEMTDYSEPIEI